MSMSRIDLSRVCEQFGNTNIGRTCAEIMDRCDCVHLLHGPCRSRSPREERCGGVNVFDEGVIPQAAQDDEIKQLAGNGVKTIRTGLGLSSLNSITQAYQHGIGTVVIVYPFYGSKAKSKRSW